MDEHKKSKNSPIIFYLLGFIVASFFELYWITNFTYDYFMILGIGLIVVIMGYLAFDGIYKAVREAEELRREQNELMIKAQKAIYLATKKNAAEADKIQTGTIQAIDMMMNKIIEAPLIAQDSTKPTDMTGLIAELTESNARLAKEVQNAVTVNQLVKANADLVQNVREVLNGHATNIQIPVMPTVSVTPTAPVTPAAPVTPIVPVAPIIPEVSVVNDVPETVEPILDDLFSFEDTKTDEEIEIPDVLEESDTLEIPDVLEIPQEIITEESSEDFSSDVEVTDIEEDISTDIADAEAALEKANEDIEAENAALEMDTTTEEDIASPFDLTDSDPNKQLSAEEIAALFANL